MIACGITVLFATLTPYHPLGDTALSLASWGYHGTRSIHQWRAHALEARRSGPVLVLPFISCGFLSKSLYHSELQFPIL